jgi:multiple sugar transport system permease protein
MGSEQTLFFAGSAPGVGVSPARFAVRAGETPTPRRHRGYIPLWMALLLAAVVVALLAIWTIRSMSTETSDGRQTIVFWGAIQLGEDIYAVVNQFEHLPENLDANGHPKYKVVLGTATSPSITEDQQRLLCAVSGGVPPDVVWFDRFAIGEWAARDALENLKPYIDAQKKDDPYRLDLSEFYNWAIKETSYARPGSKDEPGIYGVPLDVDLRVLFCNSDLLRQEGLVDPKTKQPRPPATWEELRQYANVLTRYKRPGDKSSGIARLGFGPNFGNSWLYLYSWQAGGELMNPERTKVTLDSPPVRRALRYMADVYDDLGGYEQVDAFQAYQKAFAAGPLDSFLTGRCAMKIDGIWSMTSVADWQPSMDFLCVPAPIPADRLAAGAKPVTWGGGFSLVMPHTARNKEGAWKLIQYLCSKPVMTQLEEGRRELKVAEGKLYLPKSVANRVVFEDLVAKHITGNPEIPPSFQKGYDVVKAMMPHTLYRPVTPVGQVLWNQHITAYDNGVHHTFRQQAREKLGPGASDDEVTDEEMGMSLADAQAPVQQMLDGILEPLPPETKVNWTPWFLLYDLAAIAPLAMIFLVYRLGKHRHSYSARELGASMLFISPWVIGFICLVGGPIFFTILFSFTRYDVLSPAHWVGLANYRGLVSDPLFYKSLANTAFMILRVPLTMAASLALAMLLDRAIRGLSFYRTICYMPANVPIVAGALLWTWIFNSDSGIINSFIRWLYDTAPVAWLQHLLGVHFVVPLWLDSANWSKPALIIMSIWSSGGGIIIWLAGLQSIPQQLYEAASIDGAGPWRRFWNVTIPMLSPYILFNSIIGVINALKIFDEAFVMTGGGPNNSTLFYAFGLFRNAFQYFRMGYASAMAWILFLIVLALTMAQLWLSKKWVHYDRS